ncbi:helix-turn-helix transcriptional regulator [Glycomyces tenuis]|uniref:helix-turn-helix transcriptional regulator n=1 Tax=Glycomyces tenuis TaxID=58116 RepID=UPI0004220D26|nr:WYL domain-containing protein [Glycomyces tenuis]
MGMRSERLLETLLLLRAHGRIPSARLAERLGVSAHTVLRDVQFLAAAGVPVYTERGRHGGIALMPDYRTSVAGMSNEEARALFVLLTEQSTGDLGLGEVLGSAVRKVMAALPAPHQDAMDLIGRRVIVDPVRWRRESAPVGGFRTFQEAVFKDRRLRLRYLHGDGELRGHTVDPYGLVDKSGVWYLVADVDGEPRLFSLDRVIGAEVLDEPTRRRAGVELDRLWRELRRRIDEVEAEVWVRRPVLNRFLHRHHADLASPPPEGGLPAVEHDPDWVRVELRFRSVSVARRLLDFGADVEARSPPELRRDLAETAARVADLYVDA